LHQLRALVCGFRWMISERLFVIELFEKLPLDKIKIDRSFIHELCSNEHPRPSSAQLRDWDAASGCQRREKESRHGRNSIFAARGLYRGPRVPVWQTSAGKGSLHSPGGTGAQDQCRCVILQTGLRKAHIFSLCPSPPGCRDCVAAGPALGQRRNKAIAPYGNAASVEKEIAAPP
jgi:hypothetical protein